MSYLSAEFKGETLASTDGTHRARVHVIHNNGGTEILTLDGDACIENFREQMRAENIEVAIAFQSAATVLNKIEIPKLQAKLDAAARALTPQKKQDDKNPGDEGPKFSLAG